MRNAMLEKLKEQKEAEAEYLRQKQAESVLSLTVEDYRWLREIVVEEWQRCMFLAPEPNPYEKLIDWAFERALPEVDRIDIYSTTGILLASKTVGCNSRPEPEVPEEIKDLLLSEERDRLGAIGAGRNDVHNCHVLEAYRRGQQSHSIPAVSDCRIKEALR